MTENRIRRRPELLLPAGDLEKLQTAVRFGADAVYVGAGNYSLRSTDNSFSLTALETGIRFAHERGCRVYLALNIYAFDTDLAPMLAFFREAVTLGIDAVIVADPGLVALIRQESSNVKIHLSTQANTTNSAAVRFWHNQGVSRIVLARELSLAQIKAIHEAVPEMELEAFVHGAMCVAYSGRCLLSACMIDRSANRGACAQPCRWEYDLVEKTRQEAYPVEEDARGTYILNSKDMCMIEHMPELVDTGVASLKVEGRMKTAYYVAMVGKYYRQALEAYCGDSLHYQYLPEWKAELENISHRPYGTGFFLGGEDREAALSAAYIKGYDFVGVVEKYDAAQQVVTIVGRNKFTIEDVIEVVDHHELSIRVLHIQSMTRDSGEIITQVNNSYRVHVKLFDEYPDISSHAILRRRR